MADCLDMDDVDRRLLDVLLADSRASVRELADRVGISRANAYARVARLRGGGEVAWRAWPGIVTPFALLAIRRDDFLAVFASGFPT